MATTILYASSHFLGSRILDCESYVTYVGPRARMVTTRDVQTVATPRRVLVRRANKDRTLVVNVAAAMGEMPQKRYTREPKDFVEEMRLVAIKMHTKDQVKVEKKNSKFSQDRPVSTWEFTLEKYLKFLVDSKLVFDTLEQIIQESTVPAYAGFKNTGLERAENLGRDLEWFKEEGYEIPEPMAHGKTYSQHLKDIAEKDPPAFICHFYNINFAHSAGGRMIGKKVSKMIRDNKELEFYKWDGQLSELLQNVREELNKVAELWTREEKNHCLEETEKSFKFYGEIIQILLS